MFKFRNTLLFCIIIFYCIKSYESSLLNPKVKYYETIINNSIEEANNYQLPKNNAEFQKGVKSEEIIDYGSYDFIVIGSGTAGSVIVTRLSEIEKWTILVIEAGGEASDFSDIPFYSNYLHKSKYNWGYKTTPQTTSCLGMNNHQCAAPRGKGLGGSNIINAMGYFRGNRADYEKWKEFGNPNWGWSDVFPYFVKLENNQIDGDVGYHGEDGPWNVQYSGPPNKIVNNFYAANIEKNIPFLNDYNGKRQIGCARLLFNNRNGKRLTTGRAYFENARKRRNVEMSLNSYAIKINFDRQNTAESVIFVRNDKKYIATAKREIIVSCGSYNSVQLLMLSGLGPRDRLRTNQINVVHDLPAVGENLKEHPNFIGLKFNTNISQSSANFTEQVAQFLEGYGPLTIPLAQQGLSFHPPKNSSVPIIENLFLTLNSSSDLQFVVANVNPETIKGYVKSSPFLQFQIHPLLLHERSSGSVTLKSKDPIDFPLINYNFFSDELNQDLDEFLNATKFIMSLLDTEAFRSINVTFVPPPAVCQDVELYSDPYWICLIQTFTMTLYHPTGTNRMGPRGNSVVDEHLRVYGVSRLRVVDASVIPVTISGHTNTPVIMLAEKSADIIKMDHVENVKRCLNINY